LHGKKGEKPRPIQSEEGSGVYIFRNIVDGRVASYGGPPGKPDPTGAFLERPTQGIAHDHGSPTWPIYYVYHNTFLLKSPEGRGNYGFRWGSALRETQRRVFNNIFIQIEGLPQFRLFPKADDDLQADGNLHWSVNEGANYKGDLFDKFRKSGLFEASKKRYPPGWFAHDRFADPKFLSLAEGRSFDLRLHKDSPAVDAGVEVPAHWPDPLRMQDKGRPDIGVLPLGAERFEVGKSATVPG
ncbi:MAG TPA: hypothetical protein VF982_06425, partial [Anaerolineales bacterium]